MYKKIFSGLVLVFFAVPVFGSVPEFSAIDKDKDGLVSRDEALEAGISGMLFAKLDLDKDNKLTAEEYNHLAEGKR